MMKSGIQIEKPRSPPLGPNAHLHNRRWQFHYSGFRIVSSAVISPLASLSKTSPPDGDVTFSTT